MSKARLSIALEFALRTLAICPAAHRWLLPAGLLAWAAVGAPARAEAPANGPQEAPVETVRRLCEARKALDAGRMEALLAEDYRGLQPDGSEVAYDRDRGRHIVEWERAMNTRWDYRVLGVDGDAVTVLLTEQSAYFDLLGIGTRTQVTVYFAAGGKVSRSQSKLDVQEHGSQAKAFRRFQDWLLRQMEQPEPELIGADGRLIFDAKGGARMLHWLTKWNAVRDSSASSRSEDANPDASRREPPAEPPAD